MVVWLVVAFPAYILWAGLALTIVLGTSICLRCGLRELGLQEGLTECGELCTQPRSALLRVCGECGVHS